MRKNKYSFILFFLFIPFNLYGGEPLSLFYSDSKAKMGGYSIYSENNTTVSVISQEGKAENEVKKTESFREVEARKELEISSILNENEITDAPLTDVPFNFFAAKEKIDIVKDENSLGGNVKLQSYSNEIKFDRSGRPQDRPTLSNIPYTSLPVILPASPVEVGQGWSASLDLIVENDFPLTLDINYKLEKVSTLAGNKVAEITYTLTSELKSTEVTDNPAKLQIIDLLRERGVEKISISGNGKVAFSLDKNIPMVHSQNIVLETTQRFVTFEKREVRENIKEMSKAEAFLSL